MTRDPTNVEYVYHDVDIPRVRDERRCPPIGALVVGGEGRKRRHSLVPTHLLWDPYGARDAGNYITTTRLNSPGGLTVMSELSVNDFCKRKIDQHLFAEEKELQEHAAKTKLTFSDAWLGNIAPKWAGARVPQRLGR